MAPIPSDQTLTVCIFGAVGFWAILLIEGVHLSVLFNLYPRIGMLSFPLLYCSAYMS
jgi:hypothetical protein